MAKMVRTIMALLAMVTIAYATEKSDDIIVQCNTTTEFDCKIGGTCIPLTWQCDGYKDCANGLDERSCKTQSCREGQVMCPTSSKCIPSAWRCDGDYDCYLDNILDQWDEDPAECGPKSTCPWNTVQCGKPPGKCLHLQQFCDGVKDCEDGEDEGPHCDTAKSYCERKHCARKCALTINDTICYCDDGFKLQPDNITCTDANECEIDGSCDQLCNNTLGSFICSCVPGYRLFNSTRCIAINVPPEEPPSIILSSSVDIRRLALNGSSWSGPDSIQKSQTLALDFDHRNHRICYLHQSRGNASDGGAMYCSSVDELSNPTKFDHPQLFSFESVTHIALDWVSGNWYFLDDSREMILLCTGNFKYCLIVIDINLNKPHGIALDPTKGYMFFTKWGTVRPMLERAQLDGTERKTLVSEKIVYPYGITVDYAVQHVYWVDTYLDFIERIDYDGRNRKTVRKGYPVQNLFDITVFEDNLYVTSWKNQSVIRINKFATHDFETLTNNSKPFSIHVYHRRRQPDVAHPCNTKNGGCSQICIPAWNNNIAKARCYCQSGYRLFSNGKCVLNNRSSFLLFGKGRPGMIKGIPMTPNLKPGPSEEATVPVTNLNRPTTLDYHVASQYIYWADQHPPKIARQKLDGSMREIWMGDDVSNCEGLAVDWIGLNLYWTDDMAGSVSVAPLDRPTLRKHLHTGISHPRAIALHLDSNEPLVIWADWDASSNQSSSIQASLTDGTSRRSLVSEGLHWPSGLTVDHVTKTLYWCDAYLRKIEMTSLEHPSERKVLLGKGPLESVYGLTYYSNYLFWTDLQNGTITAMHLEDRNITVLSIQNPPLFEIKAFDNSSQGDVSPCLDKKCPHLCLLGAGRVANCACADGYSGPNCGERSSPACRSNEYKCPNESKCIHNSQVCDGEADCSDGSDELVAPKGPCTTSRLKTCSDDQIRCNVSRRCIPMIWVCDGEPDCGANDSTDESDCGEITCLGTDFKCDNGVCVQANYRCDGDDDCRDGSDEKDCELICSSFEFYCQTMSSCLPKSKVCDDVIDCQGGADELNCANSTADPLCLHGFLCVPTGQCLPASKECNGVKDCDDGYDEVYCVRDKNGTLSKPVVTTPVPDHCPEPHWKCDSNTRCVDVKLLCDGKPHCTDQSDEGYMCGENQCPGSCLDQCQPTPRGPYCYYSSNFKDNATCPTETGDCNGKDAVTPYVIFSNRHEIRSVDLRTYNVRALISSLKNTIALDFHHTPTMDYIYWTDVIDEKIYRGSLIRGSIANIEVVVQTGLTSAEGLAVDWIGENLYWVESNLDQIEVAKLNGSYRRALIAGEMESPRALALDPRYGLLFWTDWDALAPRIESSAMTGEHRKVIVQISQISNGAWPNGLTLDYTTLRVYWIDARSDSIHSVDYDGGDHKVVLKGHDLLSHPFAISLYGMHVYWTDWRSNSVLRADKRTGASVTALQRTLTQPFDIQVLHPSRQPRGKVNPCGSNNGNCSHLCLLGLNSTRSCACPHLMRLNDDLRTCVDNDVVLLLVRPSEIRGVDLNQPFYHTIPTISLPQVNSPTEIDFDSSTTAIFWPETRGNHVKMSSLTPGLSKVIIDTGIENPQGFSIDWISKNMFVSSSSHSKINIFACNLQGEYFTNIYENNLAKHKDEQGEIEGSFDEAVVITSLAVDPLYGKIYWVESWGETRTTIESANMDLTAKFQLTSSESNVYLKGAKSLALEHQKRWLYWVNAETGTIQYMDLTTRALTKLNLDTSERPEALTLYKGILYFLDSNMIKSKNGNEMSQILRNNTEHVTSIKIYNRYSQNGTNMCAVNKGGCAHLCLPVSETSRVCRCTVGYMVDPKNDTLCIPRDGILVYSISWEIRGIPLELNATDVEVLSPISRVSMATSIDYDPVEDYIYWADSDHGTITRVKRDGTGRNMVVGQFENSDTLAIDWLTGLAVDWVAGNIYWADPKQRVIEVARSNGSHRHVVVQRNITSPHSLAVDPYAGKLFWADEGTKPHIICRSDLDGTDVTPIQALGSLGYVSGLALNIQDRLVYWCDSRRHAIFSMDYNGTNVIQLQQNDGLGPFALAYHDRSVFWIDLFGDKPSIKTAIAVANATVTTLTSKLGDSPKDLTIIAESALNLASNPCEPGKHECAQLCLFDGNKPVCRCSHGLPSGGTCEPPSAFLAYSLVDRIDTVNLVGEMDHNPPLPSISSDQFMRNAIGLTFNYQTQTLFYSDIQKGSINAVHFNGSNHRVIAERQGSVEGLAYGAVENSLYWTCNNIATIFKLNLTSTNTTPEVVIKLQPLDKPRGIAVDVCDSRIYWTNWNNQHPSIQRSFTNGRLKESIITSEIRMPNAIALDDLSQKLFWADARLDKIERCELDGTDRVILSNAAPQHPFAMAVYAEYIYWTDWVVHSVMRANKFTGAEVVHLRRDVGRPMGIAAIYNSSFNCFNNPCNVLNGGCSQKCRLDPQGQVKCSCSGNQILDTDGKRCVTPPDRTGDGARKCTDLEFACESEGCIPYHLTCDGIFHCIDKSDESVNFCATRVCRKNYFACDNGRCVHNNKTCDAVNNCGDFSDENGCPCDETVNYKCKSGPCIALHYRCDNDPDCPDLSDEMNCEQRNCEEDLKYVLNGRKNGPNTFTNCANTTACILDTWKCDGQNDCWDNSDEENCPTKPAEKRCPDFTCANGACLSMEWVCDGEDDCRDNSDETNCHVQCKETEFQCNDQNCIPKSWVCDGASDCVDGSDEAGHCTRPCGQNEFKCNSTGKCIPLMWQCDNTADCTDSSDEEGCLSRGEQECDAPAYFKCSNGRCIASEYYCDGEVDCGDQSDEPTDCLIPTTTCPPGQFACRNGNCVQSPLVCNGHNDCGDFSDEEVENNMCSNATCIGPGLFECKNSLCISDTLLCDGDNNCGDYSDEDRCNIDECAATNPCAHDCTDLKVGYKCSCRTGYKPLPSWPNLCVDVNECTEGIPPCDQLCINKYGSYVCSCQANYTLRPDGRKCEAVSTEKPHLIFTNKYYIRKVDFGGGMTLMVKNLTNAVALDYDWKEKCVYWSDVTVIRSSLNRMCTNDTVEVLHHVSLSNPDGLAVDWVGRNLYWCDKGTDKIEVSTLDGRHRRTLVTQNLKEPRAIAVLPEKGYLFWTDWSDKPHIGRAGMDGSEQKFIVTEGLGWPNALTIDYDAGHLYWADAREDYIAICGFDGQNRTILADRTTHPNINLHHVFAMAVFESYVFWTDWETKTIEKCTKYQLDECHSIATMIHRPMDIHVLHPLKQRDLEENPCEHLNCSALCLLTPGGGATCACPNDFILDPKNPSNCIANCTPPQIKCESTYKCIPAWWRCDGQNDCGDGSDEPPDCPKFVCHPGQFQCDNANCTHPSHICNGIDECGDRSDEKDCNNYNCMESQFKCPPTANTTGKCIFKTSRCNGYKDCPGGEDEANCKEMCREAERFPCSNGHCIPVVWVCDGSDDCGDNSDEKQTMCAERTCAPNEHRCSSGRCLPGTWVCDGTKECSDGSDESDSCKDKVTCDPTYFKCNNTKCIPGRWKCDREDDCGDNSDELGCSPRNCSESEFRCENGLCIQSELHCDGEFNCEDLSDEVGCHVECGENKFMCKSPKNCIVHEWVCDGDRDCADGSDEVNCTTTLTKHTCGPGHFLCGNECIHPYWVCDGEWDCPGGEDEALGICANRTCPPETFRCGDHKCIPYFRVCNGVADCADQSDERAGCQSNGRCEPDQFTCDSGQCIEANATCDGQSDCVDSSDEADCPAPVCAVNACSQLCITKEGRGFACRCAEGYFMRKESCKARGPSGLLLVAMDKEIHLLDPYKGSGAENHSRTIFVAPPGRMKTAVVNIANKTVYPVLEVGIMRAQLQPPSGRRLPTPELSDFIFDVRDNDVLHAADYDWTTGLFYVARESSIFVYRRNARGVAQYKTLLQDIGQVEDLALDVERGRLYWCEIIKKMAAINVARMDGTQPKILLMSKRRGEIVWPTDLAIDRATGRLYFADVKRRVIESIDPNGQNKRIIYKAEKGSELIPYKIEVFEDTLYVATHHTNKLISMHKFSMGGRPNNVTVLNHVAGPRITKLTMVQIQVQNVSNDMCKGFCHDSAICLRTPTTPICVCPENMAPQTKQLARNGSLVCVEAVCSLACHQGKCEMRDDGSAFCKCDPLYTGEYCQFYRCSKYCKNRGTCYVDLAAAPDSNGQYPLKCHCPHEWTGDQCQTPDKCCLNGGTCLNMEAGLNKGLNKCSCPPGYTGQWCEICPGLNCQNSAICLSDEFGRPACNCTPGFTGSLCNETHCTGFCQNGGTCSQPANGGPVCACPEFFYGRRCEVEKCHCQNGGTCKASHWDPREPAEVTRCECPEPWVGPNCEVDACNCICPPPNLGLLVGGVPQSCYCPNERPSYCKRTPSESCHCHNGGTCVHIGSQPGSVCRCPENFYGTECESKYLGLINPCSNYCQGGGVCTLLTHSSEPLCTCIDRTRSGKRCEECRLSCPEDYCVDRDECACIDCGSGASTALLLTSVLVLLLVLLAFSFYHVRRKARRRGFDHSRIRENVEITNPMYEGNLELTDELATPPDSALCSTLNLSRSSRGNFDNPVYAMMEEKTNLLEAG
ncbi:low-density lipoprotein receptor [Nesidiocoris tenuis]|uniref:Low-density lipoprotein receptor n=1 Tax=Nesidiocoris tenuis TaxID=355587 RepID=A0ABN7BFZ7_9HEMI|nr:low-density lipoprotein receptor [Nesidiocoris tenuis]